MKKNNMNLFYVVFLMSTVLFLVFLYVRYNDVETNLYEKQSRVTMLLANTVNVRLLHYEELLTLLGSYSCVNGTYKNTEEIHKIFQSILSLHKEIVGFGLIDAHGNYLALSSNLNPKQMPNLLMKEETKDSFKKAIKSHTMVIGRTYYLSNVKEWVMPLRKAIYNKKGKLLGVMTAGVRLHSKNSFLHNFNLYDSKLVSLVSQEDKNGLLYRMYHVGFGNIDKEKLYNTPIPTKVYQNATKSIYKINNITHNDLLNTQSVISPAYSLKIKNAWNVDTYGALSYNKRYKYYILTGNYSSFINKIFLESMKIYFLLYIISQLIFYIFFRHIAKVNDEKQKTLEFKATHDTLTKLPNKKYLYENFRTFTFKNKKFVVMYIDLDNFKNINDNFGHPIGDKLIQQVALRLQSTLDNNAILIRDGGDEFILLRKYKNEHEASYYDELIRLLGETFVIDNMEFKIGSSIGISNYPADSKDLTELLSMSDMAMYEAKKLKNTYSIYTNRLKEIQNQNVEIDQELRYALSRNEIFMMYQPQMNADGTLYGVEALVRWESAKLGFVGPDKFIPIAEESNLIVELGSYITKTSASEINTLQQKFNITFQLSINLSVKQLLSPNFIDDLLKDVVLFKGNFHSITFEITERLFIEDINHVLPRLNLLKERGFEISLDDFGTGYSSMSLLKNLPIDELKIDKSFVDEIIDDQDARQLSKAIINIGHDLSMKTVAEGVETQEQVKLLKEQKCDIFQGYYFSKPLTKEQLSLFIQNLNK